VDEHTAMVYKKFFLHCQKISETHYVRNFSELRGILWALKENLPTCLDKLEELQMSKAPPVATQRYKDLIQVI